MNKPERMDSAADQKHEAMFQAAVEAPAFPERKTLPYTRVSERRPGGARITDAAYRLFHRVLIWPNQFIHRVIPESLNPLTQSGAIANTLFAVTLVTGILLLFWYDASVTSAYSSLHSLHVWSPGGLLRSLHRYSSDACMFFVMLHALKYFFAQRSSGVRWVAWVTGVFSISVLWLEGFTGYWLVWDVRSQQIALGTAKMLDLVPVFAKPLSLSFIRDAEVSSILFFTVFFFHMLIPLAMAGGLWLHIARLNRPHFFANRTMTVWVLAALLLVSIVMPALNEVPARLAAIPAPFTMDYWYLAPMYLVDRLSGGALWALLLFSGIFFYSIPWWRKPAPRAVVNEKFCDGCTNCFRDCPFNAITMVPRPDGGGLSTVDLDRCTGCGICTGSCPTLAISLTWTASRDERLVLDQWMDDCAAKNEPFFPAIVCASSAGASLRADMNTGKSEDLPGYRVLPVPCAGWSHGRLVERMLRRGASGVLIAGCPPGECAYRHGDSLTDLRMSGKLDPELRPDLADPLRVRVVKPDTLSPHALRRDAEKFRSEILSGNLSGPAPALVQNRFVRALGAILVMLLLAGASAIPSDLIYVPPFTGEPELLVAMDHTGAKIDQCRELTAEEKASRPAHMQGVPVCERGRAPVRVRVTIDGNVVLNGVYKGLGFWQDGASVAMERLKVKPGSREVRVEIGDSADAAVWSYSDSRTLTFESYRRHVIHFERSRGFVWE
jgi:ferredoxin/coenzyme F420-reducing hydrogenase delta subunit